MGVLLPETLPVLEMGLVPSKPQLIGGQFNSVGTDVDPRSDDLCVNPSFSESYLYGIFYGPHQKVYWSLHFENYATVPAALSLGTHRIKESSRKLSNNTKKRQQGDIRVI